MLITDVETIGTTVADIERAVEEIRLPMIYDSVWERSISFQAASFNKSEAFFSQNEIKFQKLVTTTEDKLKASTHYESKKNIDRIIALYFIVALRDFSWNQKILCVDEFVNVNKIQPKNTLMIRRFCEMLEEDGYLYNVDGQLSFKVSKKPLPTIQDALIELEQRLSSSAEFDRNTSVVTNCMTKYAHKYKSP
jgi:hypothetical protein